MPHRPPRRTALAAAALAAIPLAVLIATPLEIQRAAYDQATFHLPTIHTFARQLPPGPPPLDLADYRSATTPAWHLALAALHTLTPTITTLRVANALLTAALIALLAHACHARLRAAAPPPARAAAGTLTALALAAPLAANLYTISSGAWLLPDNAAWLCFAAALVALDRSTLRNRHLLTAAAALTLALATRQVLIAAAAMLYAAAWMHATPRPPTDPHQPADPDNAALRFLTTHPARRLTALARAALATLLAWAILAAFVALWGGLVPPDFQAPPPTAAASPTPTTTTTATYTNTGRSPTMPVVTLALLGLYAPFTLATLHKPIRALARSKPRTLLLATLTPAALTALAALAVNTTYSTDAGRFSSIWNITRKLEIAHTSPPLIALAALGAASAALYALLLPPTPRLLYAAAIAGPTTAHIFTANAWPRYTEPAILITLALATATALAHHRLHPRLTLAAPVALAALHAAITASKVTLAN